MKQATLWALVVFLTSGGGIICTGCSVHTNNDVGMSLTTSDEQPIEWKIQGTLDTTVTADPMAAVGLLVDGLMAAVDLLVDGLDGLVAFVVPGWSGIPALFPAVGGGDGQVP